MNVVLVGGSGRVGEPVIGELHSHGYATTSLDIRSPNTSLSGVDYKFADALDPEVLTREFSGADAAIVLAAYPNRFDYSGDDTYDVNIRILENSLAACQANDIRQIIFASSVNAIGADFLSRPVRPEYVPLDENHPTRVEYDYCRSKWDGEQLLNRHCASRRVQAASLRLHGVWDDARCEENYQITGPDSRHEWGDRGFWGWVHATDAARAFRLCLQTRWQGHEIMFINSDTTTLRMPTCQALREVYGEYRAVAEISGNQSPISTQKARNLLGWEPMLDWRNCCPVSA